MPFNPSQASVFAPPGKIYVGAYAAIYEQ